MRERLKTRMITFFCLFLHFFNALTWRAAIGIIDTVVSFFFSLIIRNKVNDES